MAEVIIEATGVSLGYERDGERHVVLEQLDLRVAKGEFIAIVGHSGVGKSTLLRVIAGLSGAMSGQVRVLAQSGAARRPVAMVFQEARLLPWRRVLKNVMFGLEGLAIDAAEQQRRALDALRLVGLPDYADRWPHQLSGGQRQRIGIARALAVEPDLLLMDEPFAALDAITRQSLQDELLRIWAAMGKSVLFVTHDIDEAVYLADRVLLLAGTPARVVKDYVISAPRPRRRDGMEVARAVGDVRAGLSQSFSFAEGL